MKTTQHIKTQDVPNHHNQPPQITNMEQPSYSTQFVFPYGPKMRVRIGFAAEGRTKQSFKDECDINVILKQYEKTGQLPASYNPTAPQYADVTGVDFQAAQNLIAEASTMFQRLPAKVRDRFENSPAKFLQFTSNEKNLPEMEEMGLLRPINERVIPTPQPAANAAPSAPPAPSTPAS